jgi:hypothetical protein
MSHRHEALVVCLVTVLAFSPVAAGLVWINSQSLSSANAAVCPEAPTLFSPPSVLTPADPVLLPKCTEYPVFSGNIYFSVNAPVELRGSWVTSDALAVGMFNATTLNQANYGWPCPSCYTLNGSVNSTLFPGTYAIVFAFPIGDGRENPVMIATQAIEVVFDRGLDVLQRPMVTDLSSGNYSAWPISVPTGSSSFWVNGLIATTGCSFVASILPPFVFQEIQVDRGAIESPNATLLISGYGSTCPNPPVSTPVPVGPFGPLNITSGDVLVFFNSWPSTVQFSVLDPIEVSYLLPT